MQRAEPDSFEEFAAKTIVHELAQVPFDAHPSIDGLISLSDEAIPSDYKNSIRTHLALCAACQQRLTSATKNLEVDQSLLALPSVVGSFSEFFSQHSRERETHVMAPRNILGRAWDAIADLALPWRQQESERRLIPILAVVGFVICMGIFVPPAILHWQERSIESTADFFFLEPIPLADEIGLTAKQLSQAIISAEEVPRGEFAALVMGYLRGKGVPLWERGLAFSRIGDYRVRAGDTWESIAEMTLQSRQLWPVIVLLNAEMSPGGALPPRDSTIKIPIADP